MIESISDTTFTILLLGFALIIIILIKVLFGKTVLPTLIGFILFGFLIRFTDSQWTFLSEQSQNIFSFFSKLGVIVLLFRIGLESDLKGLLGQLRRASLVWIAGITVNGLLGYVIS
jgi:Kef-type K+ transport system membrane component KefB